MRSVFKGFFAFSLLALIILLSSPTIKYGRENGASNTTSTNLESDLKISASGSASCVDALTVALSESSLSQPAKDLLTLFISTLTKQSIDSTIQETRAGRKVLVNSTTQLSSALATSQCSPSKSEVTVGVCTVFNGVHHNFQEWILHYLFLGASRIVIFDTSIPSSAESIALISDTQPFVDLGLVTLIPRYRSSEESIDDIQMESFGHCYKHELAQETFIASLDSDEFLVLKNTICLNTFMESYQDYGGLRVPWRTMSPMGVVKHDPSRSFMSQYLYAIKSDAPSVHVKTIGNVKYFDYLPNQHYIVSVGKDQVDSRFKAATGYFTDAENKMYDDVELRHYYGPDWEMFVNEKVCGPGQGRVQHSAIRARLLVLMLEKTDGTEKVQDERAYALNALFQ